MFRHVALCYFFIASIHCSSINYYKELIYNKTKSSQTFQLPQSNEEFRIGASLNTTHDFGSYDFIIIGAGSAGSVVAARLSEIEDFKILLLEAGGEEDDFVQIPAMYEHLFFSEKNWGYYSTPQKNCCLGMIDQRCIVPRGKLIGGCSSINAVTYTRGNAKDYDKWESLGNPGWSYKDVLPYFRKSENSQIDGDVPYHGKGGLWNIEYALPPSPVFWNFINGSIEANLSIVDSNGKDQVGSSRVQFNIKRGKRQSSGTAFLDGARKRKNLQVLTKALATKIIIDPATNTTNGVEFVTQNQKFLATATKEVILSAGAINSPQVLILSGIGPKDHLNGLGIDLIVDLPVGKTLLDNPLFTGLVFQTNFTYPNVSLEQNVEQYLEGLGDLTKPLATEGIGFIKTNNDVPSLEYLFSAAPVNINSITNRKTNFNDDIASKFEATNAPNTISFQLLLLHEKSSGQVTLKSANPIDFPNIDFNYFDKAEDIEELIKGIEFIINLTKTDAFQKINATLIDIPICTNFTKLSKQYWDCVLRLTATSIYHHCATTPMGADSKSSVVDHNLKVHGVDKLRIVDAGVFPTAISGHPNAPVFMIAEKISDVIKKDYGK